MTADNTNEAIRPATRIIQALGICIFAVSFFLPAYLAMDKESMGHVGSAPGYRCVVDAALWGFAYTARLHPFGPLLLLSDLINLLVPAYLFLSFAAGKEVIRRRIAQLTLFCMVATWVFFFSVKFMPMVGHFLWIIGALMVILPRWIADHSHHLAMVRARELAPYKN